MKSCAPIVRAACLHLPGRRVRPAEPDVVGDRSLEQEVLLGDHDDLGAEHGVGQLPQVDPVQRDPARARVVEPAEQPRDRRLARAGLAHQGDRLPGRDVQVEPGQHEVVPVAEGHRLEPHPPPRGGPRPVPRGQRPRLGRLGHRGVLLEHAGDLLQARGRGLEDVVELRHVLQRVEEPLQVEQEGGQDADLEAPVDREQPAEAEHHARDDVADQRDGRAVDGDQQAGRVFASA